MNYLKATLLSITALFLCFTPALLAQAQSPSTSTTDKLLQNLGGAAKEGFGAPESGRAATTPGQVIGRFIQVVLGFVGTITLIVFLYGGFLWLSARGNDDQVAQAKKYISNGLIGTVIVILAYSLTYFITDVIFQATA